MNETVAQFEALRPRLLRVAYRMLGSMGDAEDVVQDAWLRWQAADRAVVRTPEAYLRRVVTRLCLDQLKSARARREDYVGTWLPDPVVEAEEEDDVTLPLMLALERLSPLERAAFLLHDVFGESFEQIAETLGRDPAACRQLARRAREHVRTEKPRFPVDHAHGMEMAEAFFAASREGDTARLGTMLASDVGFYSDGGGKRPAVARVMRGADEVARTYAALARLTRGHRGSLIRYAYVNGLPGYITREADGVLQTTALVIEEGKVRAIYVMRNPDKLQHLEGALH
ncbi:sigma-70 family RNA polymerase sigma factor [Croceibacterium sp. LX-88]|jgi:RNA polymerase sigma-70 factor (ECF subfamily)|uniref:Sigma-70 family RNA polymerase sigma factor n=1 Tax=Croceibacterium selenioxidans TaxID=2838833 RepID=A0ABS5W3T6_9SPHN|nr:sigma-70 family RNA polymerase sigma factor [Croceibacterium selenioxidans]MBT2133987.1 sigma-70 family RNA polymerase sigma factor [Croceibacterium selenioxidans]